MLDRLRRTKLAIVLLFIAYDLRVWLRSRRSKPVTHAGSTHSHFDLEGSVDYIDRVYRDYLRYGGLEESDVEGKRVLELGPGDNFGVALRFVAAGASQVVALDKFYSWRDPEHQRRIYEALLASLPDEQRRRAAGAISLDGDEPELDPERVRYVYGTGIEEGDRLFGEDSFDLIVSRAVLEHLYDNEASFGAMDRLLKPGGRMLHKVDFRDHGIFSSAGHNDLTFLTIPGRVYRWMTYHSGRPNRRLIDWYRRKVAQLGYEARLLVTHLVGRDEEIEPHRERVERAEWPPATEQIIREVRPKLDRPYRDLPDEDLAAQGVFLIARKPALT